MYVHHLIHKVKELWTFETSLYVDHPARRNSPQRLDFQYNALWRDAQMEPVLTGWTALV